jgi:hypothetical protein
MIITFLKKTKNDRVGWEKYEIGKKEVCHIRS